jgi:tetratricopeptide (TPR) repeat protein
LDDPQARATARAGTRDADPLVRLAALHLAESLPVSERASLAAPLLSDPLRALRIEAARVLAPAVAIAPVLVQDPAWQRAAAEFVAAQRYNADRPESRVALGSFAAMLGRLDDARAEFDAARRLDPAFVPAYVNAADVLRAAGREGDARDQLRDGLVHAPDSAVLHHAMGLWHARQKESADALRALERATRLAPDNPRYLYVYAVALNSFGRGPDALKVLERGAQRWPRQRDLQVALVTMYRDAGRRDAARGAATRLVGSFPEDDEAKALLRSLN